MVGGQRMEASFSTQEPMAIGEGNPCGSGETNDDRNWLVVGGWGLAQSNALRFPIRSGMTSKARAARMSLLILISEPQSSPVRGMTRFVPHSSKQLR